jgi:hypothetical protein
MHRDDDDEALKELRDLPREIAPPDGAEARTVTALRDRGLIVSGQRLPLRTAAVLLLPIALTISGFAAGWFLRPMARDSVASHSHDQPRFVLLLYGRTGSESVQDDSVAEYGRWARDLARHGTGVSGEKLVDAPPTIVGAQFTAGAPADLRGYFIVEAADEQHARILAVSHPHVKRGGTIVIRRIDPT